MSGTRKEGTVHNCGSVEAIQKRFGEVVKKPLKSWCRSDLTYSQYILPLKVLSFSDGVITLLCDEPGWTDYIYGGMIKELLNADSKSLIKIKFTNGE